LNTPQLSPDNKSRLYGGHLVEGKSIFACRYIVKGFAELDNSVFERILGSQTGICLW
jgi:hypothetical protein